jgi:hypothetical protein
MLPDFEEDANADGNVTIEKQKHNFNYEDSNDNENGKKIHGSKNASKNDTASKEDKSNAVQGELKDHDKLYFISPSEELNAYIATPNKTNSTCDDTRRFNNTSTLESINTVSSKHITPILSTNYLLCSH